MLSFDGEAEICILELGTNARGEIGRLARAVDPDLSLITNIRPSHLEGLGDMAGVLEEKLDLFRFTGEGGKIFVNADDPLLLPGAASLEREAYTFSLRGEADFRLSVVENRGWDGYDIEMILREDTVRASTGLLGEHNLYNILAASAIAWTAGVDTGHIAAALRDFVPYAMRFSPRMAAGGYLVVDDTYNANPASMASALEAFQALPCRGRRMAVLADMQELGEEARRYHRELGRFLKGGSLWKVFLLGDLVGETLAELGGERGLRFDNKADMVAELRSVIGEGDAVLVKGSRLSRLEEVVEALR
jgi:UDP-N-acetylmuramoyl-tripeptide--D-alanyl-D-alanine ligase